MKLKPNGERQLSPPNPDVGQGSTGAERMRTIVYLRFVAILLRLTETMEADPKEQRVQVCTK